MYITIYCISAQTGQAELDITKDTSGINQTAEPLKLTHRAPWDSMEFRLRATETEQCHQNQRVLSSAREIIPKASGFIKFTPDNMGGSILTIRQ